MTNNPVTQEQLEVGRLYRAVPSIEAASHGRSVYEIDPSKVSYVYALGPMKLKQDVDIARPGFQQIYLVKSCQVSDMSITIRSYWSWEMLSESGDRWLKVKFPYRAPIVEEKPFFGV